MKYKLIDSMLHNFGHSFVSLMNYVDGEYICDLLESLARQSPGHEVQIDFLEGTISTQGESIPERLSKSIRYWKDWLPKHMENHRVDGSCLRDVRFRYRLTREGREVIVEALDDRGKQHKVFVH